MYPRTVLSIYAICVMTIAGLGTAQADDRVFIQQSTIGQGSAYVLQAHQVPDRRAAILAAQRRAAAARRARQAPRVSPQPVQQVAQTNDAKILELNASGLPPLPDAHVAIR